MLLRLSESPVVGPSVRRALEKRWFSKLGSTEAVFQSHIENNYWSNGETVCGLGSTISNTSNIRSELPKLFRKLNVESILDAPCGDFHWFRKMELPDGFTYLGADIVASLVEANNDQFANDHTSFSHLNIIQDALPSADLWLCRDCLAHLPDKGVFLSLQNFLSSNIRWLLASNHPFSNKNRDIPTGSFRNLNLLAPPFSFPDPIESIDDSIPDMAVRQLHLWERSVLEEHLRSNDNFQRAVQSKA